MTEWQQIAAGLILSFRESVLKSFLVEPFTGPRISREIRKKDMRRKDLWKNLGNILDFGKQNLGKA